MFLCEPLFHNPLFKSIPKDRSFVEKFVGNNIRTVHDLLNGAGNWMSAAALAEAVSIMSTRHVCLVLCGVLKRFHDKN